MQRLGLNRHGYAGEHIDIDAILRDIQDAARHHGWTTQALPVEPGLELLALTRSRASPASRPDRRLYLSAGIHGDEPAGPLAVRQIVESAGRSLVVLSGGSKTDDETVLAHTRAIMEAGGSGVIFGRNVWQREWSQALEIIEQIKETLLSSVRRIP